MADFKSMWDLAPCFDFAFACRRSEEKESCNRGLRSTFGICPACKVDLSKPYDMVCNVGKSTGIFNPAANEFEPCQNQLHDFARKSAAQSMRLGSSKTKAVDPPSAQRPAVKRSNTLGGNFSPVINAAAPPALGQFSIDELSTLDDDSSSGRHSLDFRSTSAITPPNGDVVVASKEGEVRPSMHRTESGNLMLQLEKMLSKISSTKKAKKFLDELIAFEEGEDFVAKQQGASVSVVETLRIEPAPKGQKKLDRTEDHITAPRDVVENSTNSAAAPADGRARDQAAILAVDAAKRSHEALQLIPSSVVAPLGVAHSQKGLILPRDIDPAHAYAQYKKLAIAGKLINRLKVHGSEGATEILSGVTHVGPNYADNGIHVFIDASNIHIGFINALKLASGISKDTPVDGKSALFFESLAFILERGRKVAKRELVGSSRHNEELPTYMFDAATCGYEVSAPQIVNKMKTTTKRGFNKPGDDDWTGKAEWRIRTVTKMQHTEQLVDELIHLKMAESIIDADTPSTMVLATGDANVAEYSSGFMAYVERALKKGWKVEVVAWKESMAKAYKKLKQTNSWGDKFMILELDEYREEMTGPKKQDDWW